MSPAKNESKSDRRRRKIALTGWTLAIAVWAVFAIKDNKPQLQAPTANAAVRSIILEHLGQESQNPLFGETNISVSNDDK